MLYHQRRRCKRGNKGQRRRRKQNCRRRQIASSLAKVKEIRENLPTTVVIKIFKKYWQIHDAQDHMEWLGAELRYRVLRAHNRACVAHIRPGIDTDSMFNELRISFPNRIKRGLKPLSDKWRRTWFENLPPQTDTDRLNTEKAENLVGGAIDLKLFQGGRISSATFQLWDAPEEIDNIHPPKYYHEGVTKEDILKRD